jgi:formylglycine-generating enzyme required for sulfatase activity
LIALLPLLAALPFATGDGGAAAPYVAVPAAEFRSVLPPDGKDAPARVAACALRAAPVTNAELLAFVQAHPGWRRDRVPRVFADERYLAHWPSADALADGQAQQPATHVSWFAAQAFCEAEGGRLPTWHEWELAAAADEQRRDARGDPAWRERILAWYSRSSSAPLPSVRAGAANAYGAYDLHGLVWEWVEDYAAMMVSGDNREQGDPDFLKFCGAGALDVGDRENYAVLMRTAMLSSLAADDTTKNLGFRCARDAAPEEP